MGIVLRAPARSTAGQDRSSLPLIIAGDRFFMAKETYVGQTNSVASNQPGFTTVYEIETGKGLMVWPIDAKELVASGLYTLEPPASGAADVRVPAAIREAMTNAAAVGAIQSETAGASSGRRK